MATTMGPIGMVFKGAYDAAVEYKLLNVVTSGGNSYMYRALTAGTGKPLPVAPAEATDYWGLIASRGEAIEMRMHEGYVQYRSEGSSEAWQNLFSAADITPTFAVGTVTTGAAGSAAAVEDVGEPGAPVLNFTIPKGDGIAEGAVEREMLADDVEPLIPVQSYNSDNVSYAVLDEDDRAGELTLDGAGHVPDWVLSRWDERMKALSGATAHRMVCWGDSLTGGWPTMLQDLVGEGWTVFNAGVGGETVTSIAARQGAQVMLVNDITIPATTTPVLIASGNDGIPTSSGYGAHPMLQGGATTINPCTIAGISGNLTATFDDGFTNRQYFFTRLEAGDAVSITRPTPIITYASENLRGGTAVLYVGCNAGGYDTPEELVHLIRQMIEYGHYDQYVVLAYTKWRGTQEMYAPFDKAFSLAFGRHFLNHRAYLTEYGLDDAGLSETAQDTLDIAAGTVPVSLRADDVHFNDAAKAIIARLIKEKFEELGCSFEIASLQDASEVGEDMAIITKLPMTFTDTSLPKLKLYDPIEPEQGALLLLDAAHPLSDVGESVPANDTELASIIPSIISATLYRAIQNVNAPLSDDYVSFERTDKGGIAALYSTDLPVTSYASTGMIIKSATLAEYIQANPDHQYYGSVWMGYDIPAGAAGTQWGLHVSNYCHSNFNRWNGYNVRITTDLINTIPAERRYGVQRLDFFIDPYGDPTRALHDESVRPSEVSVAVLGNYKSMLSGHPLQPDRTWPSLIFYRAYYEDLTVSGRTYAEVQALDQALYAKDVLTGGGRYYGDTWTVPETVDA